MGAADERTAERLRRIGDVIFGVTLATLPIHLVIPETYVPSAAVHDAIGDAASQLLGCAIAFAIIVLLWVDRGAILDRERPLDRWVLRGDLVLLGGVVLAAFPTAVLIKHLDTPVAVLVFSATYAALGLWLWGLGAYRPGTARLSPRAADPRMLALPLTLALAAPLAPLTVTIRDDHFSVAVLAWVVLLPSCRAALGRIWRTNPAAAVDGVR